MLWRSKRQLAILYIDSFLWQMARIVRGRRFAHRKATVFICHVRKIWVRLIRNSLWALTERLMLCVSLVGFYPPNRTAGKCKSGDGNMTGCHSRIVFLGCRSQSGSFLDFLLSGVLKLVPVSYSEYPGGFRSAKVLGLPGTASGWHRRRR
jgi:hypothetical protein